MSEPNIVVLKQVPRPGGFDFKDIRTLDGRYRCLVRIRGYLITVVLCQTKLSPSRDYVSIGDFYSDQCRGWFPIVEVELVEVLSKVAAEEEIKPRRRWWQFWKR